VKPHDVHICPDLFALKERRQRVEFQDRLVAVLDAEIAGTLRGDVTLFEVGDELGGALHGRHGRGVERAVEDGPQVRAGVGGVLSDAERA